MAITKSYTFTNNTIADPAEVNQNFDDMIASIRAAHHRDADGTKISYQDIATGWGLIPSKGIIMFNDLIANIPTGYFFCNGSNDTPDLRNKFVLCPGQDSGGAYDTGDTGGEAAHILSKNEMPVHTHIQNAHSHVIDGSSGTGSGAIYPQSSDDGANTIDWNTASTVATNQNEGGGEAHNNMPPFIALAYIMKS